MLMVFHSVCKIKALLTSKLNQNPQGIDIIEKPKLYPLSSSAIPLLKQSHQSQYREIMMESVDPMDLGLSTPNNWTRVSFVVQLIISYIRGASV